jgi:hypothetical protein
MRDSPTLNEMPRTRPSELTAWPGTRPSWPTFWRMVEIRVPLIKFPCRWRMGQMSPSEPDGAVRNSQLIVRGAVGAVAMSLTKPDLCSRS